MIVADASAAIEALLNAGSARNALAENPIAAPHLVDAEIISALRRVVLAKTLSNKAAQTALNAWRQMEIERHPIHPLTEKIWALRNSFSAYDATYVALAAALELPLLTADKRLAKSGRRHCEIITVDI